MIAKFHSAATRHVWFVVAPLLAMHAAIAAGAPETGPKGPDYSKGVLMGRVVDSASGKVVAGATVALQDPQGKTLGWSKTDADGNYAIAADPVTVLELRPSPRRGLLEQICRAVGDVAMAPVKMAAEVAKDPIRTAKATALGVATGSPLPVAAEAAAPLVGLARDPRTAAAEQEREARAAAANAALGDQAPSTEKRDPSMKGQTIIFVTAPGHKDCRDKTGAYWLEPPDEPRKGGPKPTGMKAWLETVKLAPAAGSARSGVAQEAFLVTDASVEPSLAPAGGAVHVTAKLASPSGPPARVRMFARESKKHTVVELALGNDGVYAANLKLDPKEPAGATTVAFVALRSDPVEVKLDHKKSDPLPEFVRQLGDLDSDKPYAYDPRIMASENRVDVNLTILDPRQRTPTSHQPAPTPNK